MQKAEGNAALSERLLAEGKLTSKMLQEIEKCGEIALAEEALALVNEGWLDARKMALLRPIEMFLEDTLGGKIFGRDRFARILLRSSRTKRRVQEFLILFFLCVGVGLCIAWFSKQLDVSVFWIALLVVGNLLAFFSLSFHVESCVQALQTFDGLFVVFYSGLAFWAMMDMVEYDLLDSVMLFLPIQSILTSIFGPTVNIALVRSISGRPRLGSGGVFVVNFSVLAFPLLIFLDVLDRFIPKTYVLAKVAGKEVTISNFAIFVGAIFNFALVYFKFWLNQVFRQNDSQFFKIQRPRSVARYHPKQTAAVSP